MVPTLITGKSKQVLSQVLKRPGADARQQGRRGLVLTCKERLLPYYAKFGFQDEGVTDKSTHGNAAWHQMRLSF